MPARLAIPMFYRLVVEGRTEQERLEVDELLGDETAADRRGELRLRDVQAAGFEVAG